MMFADLVDEVDFRERLQELGAQLPMDASPEMCFSMAKDQRVDGLQKLVEQLLADPGLLQPEVRSALEQVNFS